MTGAEIAARFDEITTALGNSLTSLADEIQTIRGQLETATQHGLGPNLMAPELLLKLGPDLQAIRQTTADALMSIEQATVE